MKYPRFLHGDFCRMYFQVPVKRTGRVDFSEQRITVQVFPFGDFPITVGFASISTSLCSADQLFSLNFKRRGT